MKINSEMLHWIIPVVILFLIWDVIWTAAALWRAGRNNQLSWFICLMVFNTIGILPILYMSLYQKNKNQ